MLFIMELSYLFDDVDNDIRSDTTRFSIGYVRISSKSEEEDFNREMKQNESAFLERLKKTIDEDYVSDS